MDHARPIGLPALDHPSLPQGQLVYAVGDIHGRADLLASLRESSPYIVEARAPAERLSDTLNSVAGVASVEHAPAGEGATRARVFARPGAGVALRQRLRFRRDEAAHQVGIALEAAVGEQHVGGVDRDGPPRSVANTKAESGNWRLSSRRARISSPRSGFSGKWQEGCERKKPGAGAGRGHRGQRESAAPQIAAAARAEEENPRIETQTR